MPDSNISVHCNIHLTEHISLGISFVFVSSAYSHVVENTAFFGDVALRFPRIVHHYYDRNTDWGGLLRWGLHFCNQTGVFTGGAHQHVLTLVRPLHYTHIEMIYQIDHVTAQSTGICFAVVLEAFENGKY